MVLTRAPGSVSRVTRVTDAVVLVSGREASGESGAGSGRGAQIDLFARRRDDTETSETRLALTVDTAVLKMSIIWRFYGSSSYLSSLTLCVRCADAVALAGEWHARSGVVVLFRSRCALTLVEGRKDLGHTDALAAYLRCLARLGREALVTLKTIMLRWCSKAMDSNLHLVSISAHALVRSDLAGSILSLDNLTTGVGRTVEVVLARRHDNAHLLLLGLLKKKSCWSELDNQVVHSIRSRRCTWERVCPPFQEGSRRRSMHRNWPSPPRRASTCYRADTSSTCHQE